MADELEPKFRRRTGGEGRRAGPRRMSSPVPHPRADAMGGHWGLAGIGIGGSGRPPRSSARPSSLALPCLLFWQADIYSAALVIHYMVAGRRPSADVRKNPAARPDAAVAAARDPAAAALVTDMWAGDPEARPAAGECVRRLEGVPVPPASGCCAVS